MKDRKVSGTKFDKNGKPFEILINPKDEWGTLILTELLIPDIERIYSEKEVLEIKAKERQRTLEEVYQYIKDTRGINSRKEILEYISKLLQEKK